VPEKVDGWALKRVETASWEVGTCGWGGKTWPDGQKVWLGVETCSWGLANGNNRTNELKKHVEKKRKCT
jgi:hypothetical protein